MQGIAPQLPSIASLFFKYILTVRLRHLKFVPKVQPLNYNNSTEIGLSVREEMNVNKLTMGDRMREARKKQKLTQEQLAERLDISVEFVGQIERGLKLPSMQVFVKMVEALNVSADYLLRDSVSTGRLFGDNAIGSKIEKLKPNQRIALEALIDTYIQYLE